MRILIAEDDAVSRRMLFKIFSAYGQCDLTVDGLEALEAFAISLQEKNYYELICLDIIMPRVDGVKVLEILRRMEREHNVPPQSRAKVIVISALGDTELVRQAFEIGCEGYAAKPVDMEKLAETLQKLGIDPL